MDQQEQAREPLEVYLIVAYIGRIMRFEGRNTQRHRFKSFVRNIRVVKESAFLNREASQKHQHHNLLSMQLWDKDTYIAAGCPQESAFAVMVDRRSRRLGTPAILTDACDTVHHIEVYRDLAFLSMASLSVLVYRVRTTGPVQKGTPIKDLHVSHVPGGTIQLNCSRNVRVHGKHLYVQTDAGLVRFDLSPLDLVDDAGLESAVLSLKQEMVLASSEGQTQDFYVFGKAIVVATSKSLFVLEQKSLLVLDKAAASYGTITGTDAIVFAAKDQTVALYSLGKKRLRMKSQTTRDDLSNARRCLQLCRLKKVSFVMSLQEAPTYRLDDQYSKVGVALFAAFRYKIQFVTFYSLAHIKAYRLLGYFFDPQEEMITVLAETDKSVSLKLGF